MNKKKLQQIYNTIKEYQKIIIFPHRRPDGDAIGSTFGLRDIIKATWPDKEVHVVGESSDFTSFIGVPEQLEDKDFEGSLGIALDTANKDRIADQRYTICDKLIKIDHHIDVDPYGDIQYVDTSRPAAALIVLDLFIEHQDEMNKHQLFLMLIFLALTLKNRLIKGLLIFLSLF